MAEYLSDRAFRERPGVHLGAAVEAGEGRRSGNLYDRVVNGTVTDFVEVYAGTHYFPAFNVADSGISVGAGLLLLDMWRGRGKKIQPRVPSEERG